MRKYLMLILTVILLVITFVIFRNGLMIGNFKVLSWSELAANNDKLDDDIENLDTLLSVNFPQEQSRLNESYKQLLIKKEDYADVLLYSTEKEIAAATQTEVYETEFLWTKIGNYATQNNGIDMKIDVVKGSSGVEGQYNLNFTLVGEYAYISDFISSIENDAKLGFKIERFNMVPSAVAANTNNANNTNNDTSSSQSAFLLQTTFTVENVAININTSSSASTSDFSDNTNNATANINNNSTNNVNNINSNSINTNNGNAINDIKNSL